MSMNISDTFGNTSPGVWQIKRMRREYALAESDNGIYKTALTYG